METKLSSPLLCCEVKVSYIHGTILADCFVQHKRRLLQSVLARQCNSSHRNSKTIRAVQEILLGRGETESRGIPEELRLENKIIW
jgi:hypothetical protein